MKANSCTFIKLCDYYKMIPCLEIQYRDYERSLTLEKASDHLLPAYCTSEEIMPVWINAYSFQIRFQWHLYAVTSIMIHSSDMSFPTFPRIPWKLFRLYKRNLKIGHTGTLYLQRGEYVNMMAQSEHGKDDVIIGSSGNRRCSEGAPKSKGDSITNFEAYALASSSTQLYESEGETE